jgi:hypothetical protein
MTQTGDDRQIFWIGRTEEDPYWESCAGDLAILEFKTIYDAAAEVLLGQKCRIMVINAVIMGPELKSDVKILLAQGLFEMILIYTTSPRIAHFTPNGDARVAFFDQPGQLVDCLRGGPAGPVIVTETPKAESKPVESEPVWPAEPPCGILEKHQAPEKNQEFVRVEEAGLTETAERVSPMPVTEKPPEVPVKEFEAAELTREELQALLGSENQMEKGS